MSNATKAIIHLTCSLTRNLRISFGDSSTYLSLLGNFYMKESTYLYKHCLRSLDYVQIHTTGTDTSLKPDNLFP